MFNKIIRAYCQKNTFLTFLTAGIGTTVIYLSLFALLWKAAHINHMIAVSIAFVLAATFQFFTNRKLTFKVKDRQHIKQLLRYCTLLILNYFITVSILQFSVWLIASPFIGLIIATIVTPLTGYLTFKYWVFRNPDPVC